MSITLKKSNGDLFINPETGQAEIIYGPSKVDQELADLYLTTYDSKRDWGSELKLDQLTGMSLEQARMVLFLRLQQANNRMLSKQSRDGTLTEDERISQFSRADVIMDMDSQALIFISVADVGNNVVEKVIGQDFKPTDLNHVIAPPASLNTNIRPR